MIPNHLNKVKKVNYKPAELDTFEDGIAELYGDGKIRAPVHFSNGNAEQLCEIFQYVDGNDWVFTTWRNHFQALLHGVPKDEVLRQILNGHSMTINYDNPKIYSSAIVSGCLSIAVGVAWSYKKRGINNRAWCFIGDMAWETGICHETYKYVKNFQLPVQFVVEDNNLSTYSDTDIVWGGKSQIPSDVIYYKYKSKWPHYGVGKWIKFDDEDAGHESQTF